MTKEFDITKHVMTLADPALDGRVPLSDGSKTARNYIIEILRKSGVQPLFNGGTSFVQDIHFDGIHEGNNVGGIIRGQKPGYILVGAHYDHFHGKPGADDNAAAVSQVLSVAEQLGPRAPLDGRSILILAFDCEEPPYFHGSTMGSVFFVEHCPVSIKEIQAAIILDLTGHLIPKPGLEQVLFAIGVEHSVEAIDAVLQAAAKPRQVQVFPASNDRVGDMSDHYAFHRDRRPFIFLSCGRTRHYHDKTDTIENLDIPKVNAIASFLVDLVSICADGREFEFNPEQGQDKFKKVEIAALTRLLNREIDESEVEGIIDNMSRGL